MIKKQIAALLAVGLIASPYAMEANAATQEVKIFIDQKEVEFDQPPVIYKNLTMVPLRQIFEELGAKVYWNDRAKEVTAVKDDLTIQLKVNSPYALRNLERVGLEAPAMIVNGRTLVPLRFVSESLGAKVDWDEKTRTVNITSQQTKAEAENNLPALTLEQAVQWAVKNSYALKNQEITIEQTELVREDAADKLTYMPLLPPEGPPGNGQDDAAIRAALKNLVSTDVNLQMSKKQIEVTQDKITYAVRQAYHDVWLKEKQLALQKEAVELARAEEQVALKKHQAGLIGDVQKTEAVNKRLEAEHQLQIMETALNDARMKLNALMGQPKENVYSLVDVPAYEELKDVDLEGHIRKMLSESPSIWLLEKQVELAKLNVNLFTFNANEGPYKVKELDVNKAENTLADAKKQMEESLRSTYYKIKQLEEQYRVLEVNLQKAEEALRLARTYYLTGMNTALDLQKAQWNVKNLKQSMEEIAVQLDHLRYLFEKPWSM